MLLCQSPLWPAFVNWQIFHSDKKYDTFVLLSVVNALKGDTTGTICRSGSKINEVGDMVELISEISLSSLTYLIGNARMF